MEAKVNDIQLAYQDTGKGVPLVLVHGFPLNQTIWDPILPFLDKRLRVIAPDLRGFGHSEATQGTYSMRLLANDIAGLMDALGVEKAMVVGHSMGGYVSLAFAEAFPQRLLGLGLVSSQAGADTPERRVSRYALAEHVAREGPKPVADAFAPKLTNDPELQASLYELIMAINPAAIIGSLKGMAERVDMVPYLPEIDVPAVVVHGVQDGLIPVEKARQVVDGIPRAVLTEIQGAAHMPMMEKPEETARALNQMGIEVASLHPEYGR